MAAIPKIRAGMYFVAGVAAGIVLGVIALALSGMTVISQRDLANTARSVTELQQDNQELTEDLFRHRGADAVFDSSDLPYDETSDARAQVAQGRKTAMQEGKFLMITFGANWCIDCRTLHHHLNSDEVRTYTDDVFHFVNVDVGKFNANRDVAEELGIDLTRGIPVAVFFDPAGEKIGTTNDGQLEPARFYTSKQILRFVRDIAERTLIAAPDAAS